MSVPAHRELAYRKLQELDAGLFRRAIEAASSIQLNYRLSGKAAVEVEWACVSLVLATYKRCLGDRED